MSQAAKRIVPLLDRVLVQRFKAVERTNSGILIPEKAQEKLNEGIVLAVGPGAPKQDGTLRPVALKEGDRVLLPPYGGNNVKIEAEEFLLFNESDILAKLK